MNSNLTPIATTNHQSKRMVFGIKDYDRLQHIYCIGKTGSGKSTLLVNMAISDIQRGNGLGIIDPHGDLIHTILDYIPKERIHDVIYIDVTDKTHTIAFNPLYNVPVENRFLVADTIVSAFKKLWIDSWGPRLEHILRNTILTLLSYPHATLLDIQPLLTDYYFRQLVLSHVTDKGVLTFWHKEFEPLSPQVKNDIISPILNKIGILSSNTTIKHIIGNRISSFTIADVMNKKHILLCNLSKGYLGEAGTLFLGSLLITQFQTASLQRAKQSIHNRIPFYLYIDEMQSFITLSFADILSESRKYGLSLFLTHQHTAQLTDEILDAILGNVGTLITFRVGSQDGELLEKELYPIFTREDIINLPQYHIYLKLLIDGTQSQPFSATTLPIQTKKYFLKQESISYSRKSYGMAKGISREPITYEKPKENNIGEGFTLFD
jgi:energy-coupling factor transporter ATP-binding protein EcfA2